MVLRLGGRHVTDQLMNQVSLLDSRDVHLYSSQVIFSSSSIYKYKYNIFLPQLLNGKYSFPDDNFMLWRKKKKTNFTVSSRKEIIREMKVKILKLR